ncbi:MAG: DGQHR domain-containing protein [Rhodovulum sp.]
MTKFSFPALSISQPIGEFYLCVMDHSDLIAVSSSDIRRLKDSEFDEYIGIQRRLNPSRMKEIRNYVNSYDASFPTSVILAVDSRNAEYDVEQRVLSLFPEQGGNGEDIAVIIDGQHRIEGLKAFKGEDFEVPVCIFVGPDMQTKSTIFATVNLAQTKVNRSLAYDLLAYEKKETPQKVCHKVAVSLDRMEESPFHKRIKRLGVATEGRSGETLTQATVVEALLPFVSDDPLRDRNDLWRFEIRRQLQNVDDRKFPFRRFYLSGDDDLILANVINFFLAIRQRYPESWDKVREKGNVLPKTNGFRALMRALRVVYPILRDKKEKDVLRSADYAGFVNAIPLEDHEFTTETFPAGTSGEARLFEYLKEAIPEL